MTGSENADMTLSNPLGPGAQPGSGATEARLDVIGRRAPAGQAGVHVSCRGNHICAIWRDYPSNDMKRVDMATGAMRQQGDV